MYALVLVAMSIILSSAYLATTINYIPLDKMSDLRAMVVAEKAIAEMDPAITRLMLDIRADGDNWTPPFDFENGALTPFDLPQDLTSMFAPPDGSGYAFIPAAPRGFAWSIGGDIFNGGLGPHGVYVCLSPLPGATPDTRFFESLRLKLPPDATFVSTGCGAQSDTPNGTHFTYWKLFFPG